MMPPNTKSTERIRIVEDALFTSLPRSAAFESEASRRSWRARLSSGPISAPQLAQKSSPSRTRPAQLEQGTDTSTTGPTIHRMGAPSLYPPDAELRQVRVRELDARKVQQRVEDRARRERTLHVSARSHDELGAKLAVAVRVPEQHRNRQVVLVVLKVADQIARVVPQ